MDAEGPPLSRQEKLAIWKQQKEQKKAAAAAAAVRTPPVSPRPSGSADARRCSLAGPAADAARDPQLRPAAWIRAPGRRRQEALGHRRPHEQHQGARR